MSHWTKWWLRGEKWAENEADDVTDHASRSSKVSSVETFQSDTTETGNNAATRSQRGRRRSGSGSLENNFGSPGGSRASSIAGDRSITGSVFGSRRVSLQLMPSPGALTQYSGSSRYGSFESLHARWETQALERPCHEPPVLDYRKYEEGGRMYDSIHRHPETKKEDWYEYTDAEIENELLGDYHDWITDARLEALKGSSTSRVVFYNKLSRELDIDRKDPHDRLLDIKDKMYKGKKESNPQHRSTGKRTQQHFDNVRKIWKDIDSSDSDWDEEEWRSFGARSSKKEAKNEQIPVTQDNLRRLSAFPLVSTLTQYAARSYPDTGISRRHFNRVALFKSFPPSERDRRFPPRSGIRLTRIQRRQNPRPSSAGSSQKAQSDDGGEDSTRPKFDAADWRIMKMNNAMSEAEALARSAEWRVYLDEQNGAIKDYEAAYDVVLQAFQKSRRRGQRRALPEIEPNRGT